MASSEPQDATELRKALYRLPGQALFGLTLQMGPGTAGSARVQFVFLVLHVISPYDQHTQCPHSES